MKFAATLVILAAAATPSAAGDRPVEILLVDATPASAGASGDRCTRGLAKRIDTDDVTLTRRTAAAIRPRLGANPPAAILGWTEALLAPLRARAGTSDFDAIIVMDCRPEERVLDLIVDAPAPGAVTYRLRAIELDARVLDWLVADVLAHASAGFEP